MKTTQEKLQNLMENSGLLPEQDHFLKQWVEYASKQHKIEQVLESFYTIREYALFIKKSFVRASIDDLEGYFSYKLSPTESLTENRVTNVSKKSVSLYRTRINKFYRWIHNHLGLEIDNELAYTTPKVIKKEEISLEKRCQLRISAILKKTEDLSQKNNKTLIDFYEYKVNSGKVESHRGFVSKIFFIRRLGVFLSTRDKTFKDALRLDIQDFLGEVKEGLARKKVGVDKILINSSYKAHLLDFYRYVYEYFGDEQPRKYPEVVSWLYQGRKKSHDKLPKEILSEVELKSLVDRATEQRDKALLSLMADCSGRVGEIININIGDVKINEIRLKNTAYSHLIATVTLRGKTGERTNQLFYSVPHLRLWLLNHPLKDNPNAPLFVATKESRYGQRLSPVGINKILQRVAQRAGIKKHVHAHLFRHTNLTRMAKILSESELKIHAGWGAESNMASVYVHLTSKDVSDKILEKYGLKVEEKAMEESVLSVHICPNTVCGYQNPSDAKFCLKCGYPLSLETAVSLNQIKEKEEELQSDLMSRELKTIPTGGVKEALYQILKSDPILVAKLQSIVDLSKSL